MLGIAIDRARCSGFSWRWGSSHEDGPARGARFVAPSWRSDLEREIDLIEEVARVHGYEQIPEDRAVPLTSAPRSTRERVEAEVRSTLTGLGLDEAVTFSLVSEDLAAPLDPGETGPPIRVEHSSRRKENALRRSLIPSLLARPAAQRGPRQRPTRSFSRSPTSICLGPVGPSPRSRPGSGSSVGRDFLGLKGVVEGAARPIPRVGSDGGPAGVRADVRAPVDAAELLLGGRRLGFLGEIDAITDSRHSNSARRARPRSWTSTS